MSAPNIFQRPAPRVATKLDPLAALELRRALMLHQAGQADEAAAIYEKILREHPQQFDCLHFLGVARLQAGRHDEALALIDRALALRPGMPELLNTKGWLLRALGRLAEALACLDAALAANPDLMEARQRRDVVADELQRG
jgi:tetratricopeptide (TPR) repeat protein